MQSSTDLCVTVQLYTQVSACCWQKNNLVELELEASLATAEVGAMAKADQYF